MSTQNKLFKQISAGMPSLEAVSVLLNPALHKFLVERTRPNANGQRDLGNTVARNMQRYVTIIDSGMMELRRVFDGEREMYRITYVLLYIPFQPNRPFEEHREAVASAIEKGEWSDSRETAFTGPQPALAAKVRGLSLHAWLALQDGIDVVTSTIDERFGKRPNKN